MLGMFNKYPYTDAHELNLDFLLLKVKELDDKVNSIVESKLSEAIEKYFNKWMVAAVYDENLKRITLKNRVVVGDGIHVYDAGKENIEILGD